jgi:hypothetical protein
MDLGFNLDSRAQFRVGLRSGAARVSLETGFPALPELPTTRHTKVVVSIFGDTRDSAAEATRGTLAKSQYLRSGSMLDGRESFNEFEGAVGDVMLIGADRLQRTAAGGLRLQAVRMANRLDGSTDRLALGRPIEESSILDIFH